MGDEPIGGKRSPTLDPYSAALLDAVRSALPGWVQRSVISVATAYGIAAELAAAEARSAAADATDEVLGRLAVLFAQDIDDQRTSPLSVVRGAVPHATGALNRLGVPPVRRDAFDERLFPEDLYALVPASWREVDESLHEPGLVWGAWKAKQHLSRHGGRA